MVLTLGCYENKILSRKYYSCKNCCDAVHLHYRICKSKMVLWLMFSLLLHLMNGTHEQLGNATLLESRNQDSLMSAPKSASYHSCETNQSNATGEHLKVLASYKIDTRDKETDFQTLWPFSHSDEHGSMEFTCSQPWFYPKNTTDGSVICECGSALGHAVRCPNANETKLQVLACYCMTYNEASAAFCVGKCYYGCFLAETYYSVPSQVNATELNTFLCGNYYRDGQLCGR